MSPNHPSWPARFHAWLGAALHITSVLVLPLALLLFLQWPLRELVQAYSREANDLAQILFALYVSLAITAATRSDAHLAADTLARCFPAARRVRFKRLAALFVLVPWSLFLLWVAAPTIWQSVRGLEAFADTYNPGYFVIRTAVGLLAAAVMVQGLLDAFRRDGDRWPMSDR